MNLFYKIKSNIISFFSDIRVYWCGFILFGDSHYKIKGPDMRSILNILQPGDILLRRYSHYLGSILIPGYFSHAAVYVEDNDVIHMLGEGITKEDILTFMRCDDIAVLRFRESDYRNKIVDNAYKFYISKVEYDFNFDSKNKMQYCTELVDNCCYNVISKHHNKDYKIMPDDFLKSCFFETIWKR